MAKNTKPEVLKVIGAFSGKPHWRINYPERQPDGAIASIHRTEQDAKEELARYFERKKECS